MGLALAAKTGQARIVKSPNLLGLPFQLTAKPKKWAMARRVLPTDHPDLLDPQIGLARTYVTLGRYADAEPLLREAAEQCERSEASRRWHGRTVMEELIRLYDEWGNPDKAADWRAKYPTTDRGE